MNTALRPVPDTAADIDRFVFETDLVAVGAFRCHPDHALFGDTGPIGNHCVVFPRTSSVIEPEGFRRFVGDQAVVAVYNTGQQYRRRMLSPAGDHCDYFAVAEGALRDTVSRHDPRAAERARVFAVSHVPGQSAWYLRQRQIFRRVSSDVAVDPVEIEELVLLLVADVVSQMSRGVRRPTADYRSTRRHLELVEAVLAILALRAGDRLTLSDLAAATGTSPFHLCRVFRTVTGVTLHQRREQLRLAWALKMIEDGCDLTTVALEVGYSSHSHFTAAFRRAFGVTPSAVGRP